MYICVLSQISVLRLIPYINLRFRVSILKLTPENAANDKWGFIYWNFFNGYLQKAPGRNSIIQITKVNLNIESSDFIGILHSNIKLKGLCFILYGGAALAEFYFNFVYSLFRQTC